LTPRAGRDSDGLTVWSDARKARLGKVNVRVMTVDAERLQYLEVVQTGDDPDHYALRPRDLSRMAEWMASREDEAEDFADWHPLTREVVGAIIETNLPEDHDDAPSA
jgi:hypothetical protein